MSEKIGLARAEIVDLLSLILRAHSRDELFSLFRSAEGITPKEDPEVWREENLKKQAAGVKFEALWEDGTWRAYVNGKFIGKKEDYREVPQESVAPQDDPFAPTSEDGHDCEGFPGGCNRFGCAGGDKCDLLINPAIGVISSFNKWDRVLTEKEISDLFSGKVRPEDIPQEEPKLKEIGVGIPEEARSILMAWQRSGLKFFMLGNPDPVKFSLCFDDMASKYTIPEQSIPEGMSWATIKGMWQQGLRLDVDANFNGVWRKLAEDPKWSGFLKGQLRIPAQPIPEKLLEVSPPTPHAAERALWKVQREAGTNEIWQEIYKIGTVITTYPVDKEPAWDPNFTYRVKPMKLTAKICRVGKAYPMSYSGQDWQFTGTREEYRAECEKYGYVVISEIEEVKPKTVTYYFALCKTPDGCIGAKFHEDKQRLTDWIITCCGTIIGDIEEREIEA